MTNSQVLADMRARISAIEQGNMHALGDDAPCKSSKKSKRPKTQSADKKPEDKQPDAFKKLVALVNVSERSEHSIRERLEREGFTNEEIDEAVSRAIEYGFIDDMRFASILIRSRLNQGKGIAGIERELETHGIDILSVPGWPEEFTSSEDEFDRALNFLKSHPTSARNKRDGAYRKLVQRGFSSSIASSAARVWAESIR